MSFNNLMRNKICHIINPLSYFQTLLIIKESYKVCIYNSTDLNFGKCAGHILSNLTIIIDIFVAEHEIPHFSSEQISIISLFLIIYEIIIDILVFSNKKRDSIYSFVEELDISTIIIYCFLSMVLILLFYLFHIYLFKYKEKYRNGFLYIWF